MSCDGLSDAELLVQEGIEAAWDGEHARARDLLSLAVSLDRAHARGWLWLSSAVEGLAGKELCLERVLALQPDNDVARRELQRVQSQARLQAQALPAGGPAAPSGSAARATEELAPAGAGCPGCAPEAAGVGGRVPAAARRGDTQPAAHRPSRREPAARAQPGVRSEFALIALLGLVLLALITLGADGLPGPLSLLRVPLGLAFVLFVPGYALQAALFPRQADLDGPERLALSCGLSVALVPLLALILDRLPWGVRLWPIVAAEALVIAACSAVALLRRQRLAAQGGPAPAKSEARGRWPGHDRAARIVYAVLAAALLLAAVSGAAIVLVPRPAALFTEFYLLGPAGLAEGYSRQATPGEPLAVTAGIANREGQAAEYRIEVQVASETAGSVGPVTLQDGAVWEAPVAYALPRAGHDQQVEFLLYRDGAPEPYRCLRLWIDVTGGGRP